jgi:hypothetical protein
MSRDIRPSHHRHDHAEHNKSSSFKSASRISIVQHPLASAKHAFVKLIQGHIDRKYPKWNLDAALRYLPVAQHLSHSTPKGVLDVGSAGAGLSLYWGHKTIGLDLQIDPAEVGPVTTPIKGSGSALPFRDQSVDVVVSSDVLEHIPPEDRTQVLSEMLRVASKEVVIAVPCGRASHLAEIEVNDIYRNKTGASHPWLKEHLLYGLPEASALEEEIRSIASRSGRAVSVVVKDNTNLRVWRFLFRYYFGGGPRTARLIRYYLLTLIPLLRHMNWGKTYRKIFFIQLSITT